MKGVVGKVGNLNWREKREFDTEESEGREINNTKEVWKSKRVSFYIFLKLHIIHISILYVHVFIKEHNLLLSPRNENKSLLLKTPCTLDTGLKRLQDSSDLKASFLPED